MLDFCYILLDLIASSIKYTLLIFELQELLVDLFFFFFISDMMLDVHVEKAYLRFWGFESLWRYVKFYEGKKFSFIGLGPATSSDRQQSSLSSAI